MDIEFGYMSFFGIEITTAKLTTEDDEHYSTYGSGSMPNLNKVLTAKLRDSVALNTPIEV